MSKSPLSLILAVLGLFCFCSSACQAKQTFLTGDEQAIKQYDAGDYYGALAKFRASLVNSPNDAQIHYYLANCLIKLDQQEEAALEYRTALKLTKDATLASYCKQGINGCTSALTESREAQAVAGAIKHINSQADLQKSISESYVNSNTQSKQRQTETLVRSLEAEKDQQINSMETATYIDKHGFSQPLYSSQEIAAARQSFDQKIESAKASANREAALFRENALKASNNFDEMVTTLENSLKNGTNAKGQRLLPVGTNLYVRNYALLDPQPHSKPSDQELTATQEMLILSKKNGVFRTTVAPQTGGSDSWRTSNTSVYGKLLQSN
ncbi:MAG: hypothetical protein C5B53_12680 [Candidatus Melainabacteria bacterium]|nr:MAG: hypothetical protein C5B53_12680 [Candidatus Melainabacteria bacterium]